MVRQTRVYWANANFRCNCASTLTLQNSSAIECRMLEAIVHCHFNKASFLKGYLKY